LPQDNQLTQVQLWHVGYYRSLSTRLYNFDGKAVTPERTIVISYEEMATPDGYLIKGITSVEEFASYEEAETYLSSQESGNYQIVGTDQFSSPVPLEKVEHYRLVHSSNSTVTLGTAGEVPAVKIFEYIEEGQ